MKRSQPSAKRKLWIAMPKPNELLLPREPSFITPRKGGLKAKRVVFRDWVEHDDGDIGSQEFPEKHRREDHGRKGSVLSMQRMTNTRKALWQGAFKQLTFDFLTPERVGQLESRPIPLFSLHVTFFSGAPLQTVPRMRLSNF